MKKYLIIETIVLLFLGAILLSQFLGISWEKETLFQSCQSENIDYQSYDPYCLSIIKETQTLNLKYYILVAKQADPNYGHILNYPAPQIVSYNELENLKINWTDQGIEMETYLNTKIFIPKKNFIGGR